jgi:hypothetical protein
MPCPFTGPKVFSAGPHFLCQTKTLFTYCASHTHFVPDKNIGFCASTNAVKFWDWLKKFGPAQNILGPVKGQGISIYLFVFVKCK